MSLNYNRNYIQQLQTGVIPQQNCAVPVVVAPTCTDECGPNVVVGPQAQPGFLDTGAIAYQQNLEFRSTFTVAGSIDRWEILMGNPAPNTAADRAMLNRTLRASFSDDGIYFNNDPAQDAAIQRDLNWFKQSTLAGALVRDFRLRIDNAPDDATMRSAASQDLNVFNLGINPTDACNFKRFAPNCVIICGSDFVAGNVKATYAGPFALNLFQGIAVKLIAGVTYTLEICVVIVNDGEIIPTSNARVC